MTTRSIVERVASAAASATFGGLGGALIAAFGDTVSSTPFAMAATILGAAVLGGLAGRAAGALAGGLLGVALVGFGALVSGSALGVALTVAGSALLAGWLSWCQERTTAGMTFVEMKSVRPVRRTPIDSAQPRREELLWS